MVNSLQPPCSPGSSLLNLGSALGPHDLPCVQNDIAAIAAPPAHVTYGFLERIERSKNIASMRITLNTKSLVRAGRTFDLSCHDNIEPCAAPRIHTTRKELSSRNRSPTSSGSPLPSANGIAKALNERSIATPRGGTWTARSVLNLTARLS